MDILNVILYTIIVAVIIAALISERNQKANSIKIIQVREMFVRITNTIFNTVDKVSQTYVKDLKEHGKFDKEHQKIALKKAISEAKQLMSDEAKDLIIDTYNDLDKWIENIIESYLLKKGE